MSAINNWQEESVKAIHVMRSRAIRAIAIGVSLMVVISGFVMAASGSRHQPANAATSNRIAKRLKLQGAERPLSFEPNIGQAPPQVRFLSRGIGYTLFLTTDRAVIALSKPGRNSEIRSRNLTGQREDPGARERSPKDAVIAMRLVGANSDAAVSGLARLPGASNYFIGNDPANWQRNVPSYAKVRYEEIYPGVDLVYYGNQGRLEYDFVVAPGADAGRIAFSVETQGETPALRARVDHDGDLVILAGGQELRFGRPVVYQAGSEPGARVPIEGRYVLKANNKVGFELSRYDRSKQLVIDPVLSYSSYLGGSTFDQGYGVALDASGNIFVAGTTDSINFPTAASYQNANGGLQDAFVTKFDPTGTTLIYSTYLGGHQADNGQAVAVDSSGNAYVTGFTSSGNFPVMNAIQASRKGNQNVFLSELDPTGKLILSTYYGGSGQDEAYGIALDSSGIYVVGNTTSTDYPTVNPFQATLAQVDDAFVTKFAAGGSSVVYSTYLGGSDGGTQAWAVAVDSSQNAYVVGSTTTHSPAFPLLNPFQSQNNSSGGTVFLTKFAPAGNALVYSTYLGGSNIESAGGVAVDSAGDAYVAGGTASSDFPKMNPLQPKLAGNYDAFVTKFNPSGSALVYSTYIGGSNNDFADAVTLDSSGNVYAAGYSLSTDFPTTSNALQPKSGGNWDGFVFELNSAGSALIYSSYLGGSNVDNCDAIAVDPGGNIYLTGTTTPDTSGSDNFPVTPNAFQAAYGGGTNDAYLSVLVVSFPVNLSVSGTGSGTVTSSPPGINCGSICSAWFPTGTVVLTANPAAGSIFTGWGGACSGTGSCSVTGNSNAPVSATASFKLQAFSMTPASQSLTMQGGAQATDVITFAGTNGPFANAIQLTCSVTGTAPLPTCGISPTSVTPGSVSVTSTLTVTAPASAQLRLGGSQTGIWAYAVSFPFVFGFVLVGGSSKRRRVPGMLVGLAFLLVLGTAACGGGNSSSSSSPGNQSQPRNFNVTVTATAASVPPQSTTIAVTVQ
jgi:hypothetical protein